MGIQFWLGIVIGLTVGLGVGERWGWKQKEKDARLLYEAKRRYYLKEKGIDLDQYIDE